MHLINSSFGCTVQTIFVSLMKTFAYSSSKSRKCVWQNQADYLWMISREVSMLWKDCQSNQKIIFYIKVHIDHHNDERKTICFALRSN